MEIIFSNKVKIMTKHDPDMEPDFVIISTKNTLTQWRTLALVMHGTGALLPNATQLLLHSQQRWSLRLAATQLIHSAFCRKPSMSRPTFAVAEPMSIYFKLNTI